jgi:simple sugar transport system ATP-binding protein
MQSITKTFPGVVANDHVDLSVEAGEVHALIGENGAGKTTLMNILYGLYQADSGRILIQDQSVLIDSPKQAIALGIGMVHQHFMLVQRLSVAENVSLGQRSSRGPLLDTGLVAAGLKALSERYGLRVDPSAMVWQLPVGVQQRVEILKALYRGAHLLILDEPTAILTPQEIDELFSVLRSLVKEGHSIIFISHKLKEVLAVSDRITVLRGGRVQGTVKTVDASVPDLARMMVGHTVSTAIDKKAASPGATILEVRDLTCYDDRKHRALNSVSFDLHRGEILGVAGVEGNGQAELAEVLAGLRPLAEGRLLLADQDVSRASPGRLIASGLSYVPSDRHRVGSVANFSLAENVILKSQNKPPFARRGMLRPAAIAAHARRLISDYDIRAPGIGTEARVLSGGNLQKLIVAREVARCRDVLLAVQPTRGLDLATTDFVHRQLIELRDQGVGIVLISTELDEILALSDRVAVLYEGQIMGIVRGESASRDQLGLLMAGVHPREPSGSGTGEVGNAMVSSQKRVDAGVS